MQPPVVDLVVVGRQQAAGQAGGEGGFGGAQFPAGQQLERHAERRVERVQVAQVGEIGGVPGDLHRAAAAVADVEAGLADSSATKSG